AFDGAKRSDISRRYRCDIGGQNMKVPGMRRTVLAGGKVNVWSDETRIILQVRTSGPEDEPLVTWAKAAAELSTSEALELAAELLRCAARVQWANDGKSNQ